MKYGRKVNLSLKSCSDFSESEYNLRNCSELGKSCSKRKKLLEIREVAKKLPSNLWKALGLGGGIEGGRPGYSIIGRGKEQKVAGGSSSTEGGSFGPPASPLVCVNCIPYS